MKNIFVRIDNKGKKRLYFRNIVLAILSLIIIVRGVSELIINYIGKDLHNGSDKKYLEQVSASKLLPNIVLIYVDDLGYGDLSITGSKAINTPNIDAMGENGVMLTNYYAPAPICSASRAGLLTGRYPLRTHTPEVFMDTESVKGHLKNIFEYIKGSYSYGVTGLPTDEILLSEVLQQADYETALVGKWHLGIKEKERPNENGFDLFYGALYSDDMEPYKLYKNKEVIHDAPYDQANMTQELTSVAVNFIEENKEHPFFLYYASPFPHYPANASKDFIGTSKAGIYGDCVQEIDWSVGEIIKTLEENDLEQNTLVIFTSDNGPWFEGSTGGSRGRKDTTYDGGQHVPFLAYMPGTLPAGAVYDGLMSGVDLFPTILSMVDIDLPTDRIIDGMDMGQFLKGMTSSPRQSIIMNKDKKSFAIIDGDFKYMERTSSDNGTYWMLKQGPYLYNLATDPDEAYDVTNLYPEVAKDMKDKLDTFKASIKDNLRGWK